MMGIVGNPKILVKALKANMYGERKKSC